MNYRHFYEKRLTTGDANILEVNKIKMERMNVQTEVAQNSASITALPCSLCLPMNGNMPLEFAENHVSCHTGNQ